MVLWRTLNILGTFQMKKRFFVVRFLNVLQNSYFRKEGLGKQKMVLLWHHCKKHPFGTFLFKSVPSVIVFMIMSFYLSFNNSISRSVVLSMNMSFYLLIICSIYHLIMHTIYCYFDLLSVYFISHLFHHSVNLKSNTLSIIHLSVLSFVLSIICSDIRSIFCTFVISFDRSVVLIFCSFYRLFCL